MIDLPALARRTRLPSVDRVVAPAIPDHVMLRRIGRGSYGEVWLAKNALGTYRAVKVVYREAFDSDRPYEREFSGIQRFEPISRSHDGLVDVLQVGRNDAGAFFYTVMELADAVGNMTDTAIFRLDGGGTDPRNYSPRTLSSDLEIRGRIPVAECLPNFLNLTSALGHLHRHGLVHRDIKPSNIIFVNGVAKLADIGLVADATEAASYVGTEGFIPPEGPGTRQADIYSLGKVFFEAATGSDRTKFPSLPIELADVNLHADLLELNAVILKACAPDPRQRYQTAEELASELALLQSGRSVKRMRQVETRLGRARRVLTAAALITIIALVVSLIARQRADEERKLRDRAEQAEHEGREQLWRARLNEARALRRSHDAGSRQAALQALTEAATVRVDRELRSEAAACLALVDFEPVPFESPAATNGHRLGWVPGLRSYFWTGSDGSIEVRDTNHQTRIRVPGVGQPLGDILDVSPGGRWIFTIYADNSDALWDLAKTNGGPRKSFEFVWVARAFDRDDRHFGLLESDGFIRVLDLVEDRQIARFKIGAENGLLALGGGGRFVAGTAGIGSKEFAVWEVATGRELCRVRLASPPRGIDFLDGDRVIVTTLDNDLHLFDPAGNRANKPLVGHLGDIVENVPIPGRNWLLTRSWDGSARLWDLRNGQTLCRQVSDWASFVPGTDGRLGALDESSKRLTLQRLVSESVVRALPHQADDRVIGPEVISFSPDGRLLVSTAADGARFWHVEDGRPAGFLKDPMGAVTFDSGGDLIAENQSGTGVQVRKMHLGTNGLVELGPRSIRHPGPAAYFRRTAADDRIWLDRLDGRLRLNVRLHDDRELALVTGRNGVPEKLEGLGFLEISADGKWIYAATRFENRAWIWEAATGREVMNLAIREGATGLFITGRDRILIGDYDRYRMMEIPGGKQLWSYERPQGGNISGRSALSPDGSIVAVLVDRSTIALIDTATGNELLTLEHPMREAAAYLAFSPDSAHLAIANETHVVHLWDLRALRRQLDALGFGWDPGLEALGK